MNKTFTYTDQEKFRWLLSVAGQEVQIFCDGESRIYDIPENIIKCHQKDEYVYIYVQDPTISFYQFKFEEAQFLVGDVYEKMGKFRDTFASHVFGEEM